MTATGAALFAQNRFAVYIAGYEKDAGRNYVPVYWKNGVKTVLPVSAGGTGEARAIAVTLE
jgi:hypothetical protein